MQSLCRKSWVAVCVFPAVLGQTAPICASSCRRDAGVISLWNPVNYRPGNNISRIMEKREPVLNRFRLRFMFKWGFGMLLPSSSKSPLRRAAVILQGQSSIT